LLKDGTAIPSEGAARATLGIETLVTTAFPLAIVTTSPPTPSVWNYLPVKAGSLSLARLKVDQSSVWRAAGLLVLR
jgi:hypothetical protein